MTTNSEARKRREERQANCVCNPGDHCWSCGQPQGHSDNAVRPDDSVITIEISREDAEELVRVVEERDDLMSSVLVGSWTFTSELRLKAKLQAALAGEK